MRLCAQDGGVLLDFAFPPFFFQNGGRRSFQRRQPLVSFLSPFLCETTKKGHFCFHRARAARRSRGGLCEAQGEVAESLTKSFTAFSFDAHTALRARSLCCLCLFFALPQRIGEEKALRGLMPLRTPQREKVASLSLCSSFREVEHLQLLRVRLKESRTHGSNTQAPKQKILPTATHLGSTNFSAKTISPSPPAARGGKMARDVE